MVLVDPPKNESVKRIFIMGEGGIKTIISIKAGKL